MLQSQYLALKQPTRILTVKVDIIGEKNNIINSLKGIVLSGSININADSPYRRSGNISLFMSNKYNLIPSPESNIWFNKKVGISVGIKNYSDDIVWFNLGRFAVLDCDLNYDISGLTMNLNLDDLMVFLDGTLGGQLSQKTKIENKNGLKVTQAIASLLNGLLSFSLEKISINDMDLVLPYEIEKPAGTNIYEIVSELVNLYMGYNFYFDENGYLIVERIKNKKNDDCIWDFTNTDFTLVGSNKINFTNVKNDIWVYGRTDEYNVQITQNYCNRFSRKTISEMNLITDKMKNDICYVFENNKSYIYNGTIWELLSFNVIPIFNVENIGRKPFVYNDEKIFNQNQAKTRCQYQLEVLSNFAESVNFSTIPIYSLDVNKKIKVQKDNLNISGDYLIKNISFNFDVKSPMTLSALKIY